MMDDIPQIIAIVPVSPDGTLNLKKDVRQHLGMKEAQTLFLDMQDDTVLSAEEGGGGEIAVIKRNRIRLPEEALRKLGIDEKSLVGFVQRRNAVAIKKFEIIEKEAERARIVDLETSYKINRIAETNPMPDKLLLTLEERYKGFKLRHDIRNFLKGRQTLEAWKARRILGTSEPSDEELRRELIRQRLEEQREDNSWEGKVTITARNLRELADLGMTKDDNHIQRAVEWLLNQPQSAYNPGMFFLKDELIKEQDEIIKSRQQQKRGTRERFRNLKASEKNLVKAGDDLILNPCGPRIMWPNALVLEALLKLGYEEDSRVQTALQTLMTHEWCECAYQHGLSEWKRKEPYTTKEIEKIEGDCKREYKYGGVSSTGELAKQDLAHRSHMLRIAVRPMTEGDEYALGMQTHLQGCEVATTRALSQVKNERNRRLAEAHLWRFAGRQHSTDGKFAIEKYGTGHSQAGFLGIFARYDHPISKVVIMRSIPWILNSQNEDGSWGDELNKDASTLAVISALENTELI